MTKFTTEYFIERAKAIHNDLYDYDSTVYIKAKEKVKIFCKKCKKFFEQAPHHHLCGVGCPYCKHNRNTIEQFIQKAKIVHGDKYDYSETIYDSSVAKVKIYCKTCKRFFLQRASAHLSGQGCPSCKKCNTIEQFIQKAKAIHGDKYNYNKVEYKNCLQKVEIYCNKCKKYFWQKPREHLRGNGCQNCGKIKCQNCQRSNKEEFIYKSIKLYGNLYNYDKVEYFNCKTHVKIYCNNCKQYFYVKPGDFIQGKGCPFCCKSIGEKQIQKILKLNNIKFELQKDLRIVKTNYRYHLIFICQIIICVLNIKASNIINQIFL